VAATAMHREQAELNERWEGLGREPFGLGIGLSTGEVAAALLGSEERIEYSLVGDTVNLTQRLQQWAAPGQTVISDPTRVALTAAGILELLEPLEPGTVKGRQTLVQAWRIAAPATVA